MKVIDLLDSCQNECTAVYLYDSEDAWEDDEPYATFENMGEARSRDQVEVWYMDVNFVLHILVKERFEREF